MNTAEVQSYKMHPRRWMYWLTCAMALLMGIGAVMIALRVSEARKPAALLGALFILCGLFMFIRPETAVDSDRRVVRRCFRLLRRCVWLRTYPFSQFAAVSIRHVRRSGWADDADIYFVSLHQRCGRRLIIAYFESDTKRSSRLADELAKRLSTDLGIKIVQEDQD